jgi:hypothetical protein
VALTPEQRIQRARLAAHTRWSQHDSVEHAHKMRAAFEQRFLDEVDPDRELPEDERYRRAEHARKAFYTDLAYRSARARRLGAEADDAGG